jgi:hypothetical protein
LNLTWPCAACKIRFSSHASKHEVVPWPRDDEVDHAGDATTESVLAVTRCHRSVMPVTMLLSPAHVGAAKLVLVVVHQGPTVDHLGVTADCQGATSTH